MQFQTMHMLDFILSHSSSSASFLLGGMANSEWLVCLRMPTKPFGGKSSGDYVVLTRHTQVVQSSSSRLNSAPSAYVSPRKWHSATEERSNRVSITVEDLEQEIQEIWADIQEVTGWETALTYIVLPDSISRRLLIIPCENIYYDRFSMMNTNSRDDCPGLHHLQVQLEGHPPGHSPDLLRQDPVFLLDRLV